jgi:hypothetical protein
MALLKRNAVVQTLLQANLAPLFQVWVRRRAEQAQCRARCRGGALSSGAGYLTRYPKDRVEDRPSFACSAAAVAAAAVVARVRVGRDILPRSGDARRT